MRAVSATRAAGILAGLAMISALLSAFVPPDALVLDPQSVGLGLYLNRVPLLPGIFFGIVLAFAIYVWGTQNPVLALSGIVSSLVAWSVAVNIAVAMDRNQLLGGLIAGTVGAAITSAGIALVAPSYRRILSVTSTILAGGLSGTLLYFMGSSTWTIVPLYLAWQSTVAATIAYGIVIGRDGVSSTKP